MQIPPTKNRISNYYYSTKQPPKKCTTCRKQGAVSCIFILFPIPFPWCLCALVANIRRWI